MNIVNRHCLGGALLLLFLAADGCNQAGPRSTVSGKITLDDKPLEKGSISFYPQDKKGHTAGGQIVNGEYLVSDVFPGKNKVEITATTAKPPAQNIGEARNSGYAKMAQQAGKMSKGAGERMAKEIQSSAGIVIGPDTNTLGNGQILEIKEGKNTNVDIALKSTRR
jgi:hypothetical protein